MLRVGTIDHGLGEELWCCKCEDVTQKYNATLHNAHSDIPDYLWYGRRPKVWEYRTFGCRVEAKLNIHLTKLAERTETGYFIGKICHQILETRGAKTNTILYNSKILRAQNQASIRRTVTRFGTRTRETSSKSSAYNINQHCSTPIL